MHPLQVYVTPVLLLLLIKIHNKSLLTVGAKVQIIRFSRPFESVPYNIAFLMNDIYDGCKIVEKRHVDVVCSFVENPSSTVENSFLPYIVSDQNRVFDLECTVYTK